MGLGGKNKYGYWSGNGRQDQLSRGGPVDSGKPLEQEAERTGVLGTVSRAAGGRDDIARAGIARGRSVTSISKDIQKYEQVMGGGGRSGGATNISAQSFSAKSPRWAGRVGPDRRNPNSFGDPAALRTQWDSKGGLLGSGSLKYRWNTEAGPDKGSLNSPEQQQAAFEKANPKPQQPETSGDGGYQLPDGEDIVSKGITGALSGTPLQTAVGLFNDVVNVFGAGSPLATLGQKTAETLSLNEKLEEQRRAISGEMQEELEMSFSGGRT